jgi:hypothetical protein
MVEATGRREVTVTVSWIGKGDSERDPDIKIVRGMLRGQAIRSLYCITPCDGSAEVLLDGEPVALPEN